MPFVEVKMRKLVDECAFSNGVITIPKTIYDKYTAKKHVQLFVDEENKLVGVKPSNDGYAVFSTPTSSKVVWRMRASGLIGKLKNKRYPIEWDEPKKMFIINYGE